MSDLADMTASRLEFERIWSQLAPLINEAEALEALSKQKPTLLNDPWVQAHTRWLVVFGDELDAVSKVRNGLAHGVKLPAEEIRAASETEQRLLDILLAGRERVVPRTAELAGTSGMLRRDSQDRHSG